LYLIVLNYDLAGDRHISIYYVFAQRFVCAAHARITYACHICDVFVARHLDIFRPVHVNKCYRETL